MSPLVTVSQARVRPAPGPRTTPAPGVISGVSAAVLGVFQALVVNTGLVEGIYEDGDDTDHYQISQTRGA